MKPPSQTLAPDVQKQMASLGLAVILLGPELRIVRANPAAEQFFGQSLRRHREAVGLFQAARLKIEARCFAKNSMFGSAASSGR